MQSYRDYGLRGSLAQAQALLKKTNAQESISSQFIRSRARAGFFWCVFWTPPVVTLKAIARRMISSSPAKRMNRARTALIGAEEEAGWGIE